MSPSASMMRSYGAFGGVFPVEMGVAKVDADRHAPRPSTDRLTDCTDNSISWSMSVILSLSRYVGSTSRLSIIELDRVRLRLVEDRRGGRTSLLMIGTQASMNSSRVGYAPVEYFAFHMRLPTVYGDGTATMIFESVRARRNSASPAAMGRRYDILEVTAG